MSKAKVSVINSPQSPCPCGSSGSYSGCCGRFHNGGTATTPEQLMRSRYSAYTLGLSEYLLASWHPSTRPVTLSLDQDAGAPQWLGLKIRATALQDEHHGTVEFVARWRIEGRAERMHELSRFVREDGRWFYLDGEFV